MEARVSECGWVIQSLYWGGIEEVRAGRNLMQYKRNSKTDGTEVVTNAAETNGHAPPRINDPSNRAVRGTR